MDRMQSFNFDEEFYEVMLKKYSQFEEFEKLMLSTRDYNSIQSLYEQLQIVLSDRKDILDIYQYYSFTLLYQIANRNNLIGFDSMVLQMLIYMNNHGGIENKIFSSDYIWHVYLTCNNLEKLTKQYIENRHISDGQFYDLIQNINEDCVFFEKKDRVLKFEDLKKQLQDENIRSMDKEKLLADYLVSIWIHGDETDKFYKCFVEYIENSKDCVDLMLAELRQYKYDKFLIEYTLSLAEYQLHELGYLNENNKFRNISLLGIIKKGAKEGSYSATRLAASYLKLANYEKRDVDIENLAYAWSIYFEHKDYSVFTIDTALIVFENKGYIDEKNSFKIITTLMDRSDDGISSLLTSYVNKKGIEYYNYSILTPNVELMPELENRGIKYFGTSEENKVEYTPFCYGCIHEDDIPYIIENNISFEDISKFTDGWDSCLPFVDIYKIYDRQDIQNSYMEIIHNSIYARANQRDYLGNWNLLIGNIPEFLYKYEINVDWDRIFNIFENFLALSLLEKVRR